MKKIIYLALLLLLIGKMKAQQLTPTTICSGGRAISNGGIMLEDNLGGLMVSTISTATFMYTQGFLQPDAGTTTVVPPINDVVLNGGAGIDNGGTTFVNGDIMLEFTVGEVISRTFSDVNNNNFLTQGILQPHPTFVWSGAIDNNWFETGNWTLANIPTNLIDVIIPTGCANYPVIFNGQLANCHNLSINPSALVIVLTGGKLKLN